MRSPVRQRGRSSGASRGPRTCPPVSAGGLSACEAVTATHRASSLPAPIAGGVLFSLGIAQARRLANGTAVDARRAATVNGPARTLAGALLLIRPEIPHRILHTVPESTTPHWLSHMLAVRETILGLCTYRAGRTGNDVNSWLLALALVDAGEALIVLHAIRRHEVRLAPALAFVAADAGSAATAVGVIVQQRRAAHTAAS
jgi:hypothetical protein